MKYSVRVIPQSKRPRVEELGSVLKIYVKAPAREGKANVEVAEALAKYFNVSKSSVTIVRGLASKTKLVEVKLRP